MFARIVIVTLTCSCLLFGVSGIDTASDDFVEKPIVIVTATGISNSNQTTVNQTETPLLQIDNHSAHDAFVEKPTLIASAVGLSDAVDVVEPNRNQLFSKTSVIKSETPLLHIDDVASSISIVAAAVLSVRIEHEFEKENGREIDADDDMTITELAIEFNTEKSMFEIDYAAESDDNSMEVKAAMLPIGPEQQISSIKQAIADVVNLHDDIEVDDELQVRINTETPLKTDRIAISTVETISVEHSSNLLPPIVGTSLGAIQGSVLMSRLGRPFYAFRGIRYAEAPVGEQRFRPAVPVSQLAAEGQVYNGTVDGPMCVQFSDNYADVSEDCLRLNVYTHHIDNTTTATSNHRKPVLVYLHPGGFYSVSGQSWNYAGPQTLLDRDIVLVTINYRLGTLGLLATGTADYPGNAALKDQVLAMRWVRQHIAHFGGDPDAVTLMGYSAGAISVTLHMVSPMSEGLFHRAIVMSGAATSQMAIGGEQLALAQRQARLLGCSVESVDVMMECMKSVNATAFGQSLPRMFEFGRGNPILLWMPVVEPDFGQERFLTDDPNKLFLSGRFHRVPVMAGITEYEFLSPAIDILQSPLQRYEMDTNFSGIAPICLLYERGTDKSRTVSQSLRKYYINGPLLDERSLPGLAMLFADGVIGFGMHRFVQLASVYTTVFYYKNSYVGRYSHVLYPADKPYGTVHHDDLLYLFVAPAVAPMFEVTDPENLQVERMTRMWTNFAHQGDPNNRTDEVLSKLRWLPTSSGTLEYLNIGNELEMHDRMFADRYATWEKLFALPVLDNSTDSM